MKRHAKIIITISYIFISLLNTKPARSQDTLKFDIRNYRIALDITDLAGQLIKGNCQIIYNALDDISKVYIQLKSLNVDSVFSDQQKCNFDHKNENLTITLGKLVKENDLDTITVFYHGHPVTDVTWGGFYFSNSDGGYAYNMGIGMGNYPHACGRAWFPCVDNFTDRAQYTFIITTGKGFKAFCGGNLVNVSSNPDSTLTWQYEMKEPITTDLASVAVGRYSTVTYNLQGIKKKIPVVYGALSNDTAAMKLSFRNLKNAFDLFENIFGPYLWDKVGYVVVPFTAGAMEHATNIAYPRFEIDGTMKYELTMVHELSHSWWGNQVKCANSFDMWLNEGWAEYCEKLFIENIYGREAYNWEVLNNHRYVLQYAHIKDSAVLPLSPLPRSKTYGATVYKKGTDVIHTLRYIIGDSLFFPALKKYLENNRFTSHNSLLFMDSLNKYTGIKLNSFFDEWVFQPGQPHFSVDCVTGATSQGYNYDIKVKQKSRFNCITYHQVPVIITIRGKNWETYTKKIILNSESETVKCNVPFAAALITVNLGSELSDANTREFKVVKNPGTYDFPVALMKITVNTKFDSAFLLVEHHWIGPENTLSAVKNIRFSDYRYWTFSGILPNAFDADAEIKYNGTEDAIYDGSNYLDHTLNIENEDSLVVMYRIYPNYDWEIYSDVTFYAGNKTDKKGRIVIHHLKEGDYCLGKRDIHAGTGNNYKKEEPFRFYPNPAKKTVIFEINKEHEFNSISIVDISGKILKELNINGHHHLILNLDELKNGTYFIVLNGQNEIFIKKIILGS